MDGIIRLNVIEFGCKLRELVTQWEAWRAAIHGHKESEGLLH